MVGPAHPLVAVAFITSGSTAAQTTLTFDCVSCYLWKVSQVSAAFISCELNLNHTSITLRIVRSNTTVHNSPLTSTLGVGDVRVHAVIESSNLTLCNISGGSPFLLSQETVFDIAIHRSTVVFVNDVGSAFASALIYVASASLSGCALTVRDSSRAITSTVSSTVALVACFHGYTDALRVSVVHTNISLAAYESSKIDDLSTRRGAFIVLLLYATLSNGDVTVTHSTVHLRITSGQRLGTDSYTHISWMQMIAVSLTRVNASVLRVAHTIVRCTAVGGELAPLGGANTRGGLMEAAMVATQWENTSFLNTNVEVEHCSLDLLLSANVTLQRRPLSSLLALVVLTRNPTNSSVFIASCTLRRLQFQFDVKSFFPLVIRSVVTTTAITSLNAFAARAESNGSELIATNLVVNVTDASIKDATGVSSTGLDISGFLVSDTHVNTTLIGTNVSVVSTTEFPRPTGGFSVVECGGITKFVSGTFLHLTNASTFGFLLTAGVYFLTFDTSLGWQRNLLSRQRIQIANANLTFENCSISRAAVLLSSSVRSMQSLTACRIRPIAVISCIFDMSNATWRFADNRFTVFPTSLPNSDTLNA